MANLEDLGGGYFREEGTTGPGEYYGSRTAAENALRGGGGGSREAAAAPGILIVLVLAFIAVVAMSLIFVGRWFLYVLPPILIFGFWIVRNKMLYHIMANAESVYKIGKVLIIVVGYLFAFVYYGLVVEDQYGKAVNKKYAWELQVIAPENGNPINLYPRPQYFYLNVVDFRGKPITVLESGDTVTVLGATRNRQNYKVITADNKKGYISWRALPEERRTPRFSLWKSLF